MANESKGLQLRQNGFIRRRGTIIGIEDNKKNNEKLSALNNSSSYNSLTSLISQNLTRPIVLDDSSTNHDGDYLNPVRKNDQQPIVFTEEKQFLDNNIICLKWMAIASSMQFLYRSYSKMGTGIAVLLLEVSRFCYFLSLSLRFGLYIYLNSCKHNLARYYIIDWTIFYPTSSRLSILRAIVCFAIVQLITKRAILMRSKFDTSLLEFLSHSPPDEHLIGDCLKKDSKTRESLKLLRQIQAQRHQISRLKKGSFFNITNTNELDKDNSSKKGQYLDGKLQQNQRNLIEQIFRIDEKSTLRDKEHWFALSLAVKRYIRIFTVALITGSFVAAVAIIRIGYLLDADRSCDYYTPLFRVVGAFELGYCLFELLITNASAFFYTKLITTDLLLQADKIEGQMELLIEQYNDWATILDQEEQQETLGAAPNSPIGRRTSTAGAMNTDPLISSIHRGNLISTKSSNSNNKTAEIGDQKLTNILVSTTQTTNDNNNNNNKLLDGGSISIQLNDGTNYYSNIYDHSISSRGQTSFSNNRYDSTIHLLIPDYIILSSATNSQTSRSTNQANNNHLNHLDNLTVKIIQFQKAVIIFLKTIDDQKATINFLGIGQYVAMIASLSLVPILMTGYRDNKTGLIIYLYICSVGLASGFLFSLICSGVNQRACSLASRIFLLCSKHHSRAIVKRWNKVFLIWFCPSRCAFRVAGLDLTYLNMMKNLSFLLSGLTILLNYNQN